MMMKMNSKSIGKYINLDKTKYYKNYNIIFIKMDKIYKLYYNINLLFMQTPNYTIGCFL